MHQWIPIEKKTYLDNTYFKSNLYLLDLSTYLVLPQSSFKQTMKHRRLFFSFWKQWVIKLNFADVNVFLKTLIVTITVSGYTWSNFWSLKTVIALANQQAHYTSNTCCYLLLIINYTAYHETYSISNKIHF